MHNSWDCAMWCPTSIMVAEWKKALKRHVSVYLELKCSQKSQDVKEFIYYAQGTMLGDSVYILI